MRRALPLAALLALALPAAASAHATLVGSTPADGARVKTAPREARFRFDDVVRVASGIRAIRNGGGSVLGGKARVVRGRTLVVPLRRLTSGDYTVLWRVISDDGHTEQGVIAFAVGAAAPAPSAALSGAQGRSWQDVLSRWLFFAGLLVAGGGALFRLVTRRGNLGILFAGEFVLLLGATGLIGHEADFSTRFGASYGSAAIVGALGATITAIAIADARAAPVAWLLPLLALPLPSVAGHALDAGRSPFQLAIDIVHVAAAAFWVGGLVQLAFLLRRRDADVVRSFSTAALWSVVVLSVTGVGRAVGELGAVDRIWTTGYGRLLIAKTALLSLLVGLGWLNRERLLPRLELGPLARSVRAELVLVIGLVVAVALLTDSRPGRDAVSVARAAPAPRATKPPLPPRDAVVLAREDGPYAVALAAEPRRLQVTVLGQDGTGARGLHVSIQGAPASPCGSGCYASDAAPTRATRVTIDGRTLVFAVPRRTPPATALVARATRVFRSARSVRYVERLASSPTNAIVTQFTLERPDRLEYRIRGGASAVVIGARRWDRFKPGGRWQPSQTTRNPQPVPVWNGPVTNAHVLTRTRDAVVVSFLNPKIPAWFTVAFDPRTLRPRTLHMTAAAHFMFHRYAAFGAARRITPPS